ncbi:MAG TPA: aldehyde dehydrogenase family protein, partial [Blastocatellia bacterium]|nr:aldehyde dehydrogenase family protein [Blastocatellia bacterium]
MAKPAATVRSAEYRNFINGEWVVPSTGAYIENRNPADRRDLVGLFPASSVKDVGATVNAAAEAFKKWRKVP